MTLNKENLIKVMLVDDSAAIRAIFNRIVSSESDMEIVASVSNGQIAIENLKRHNVDVIILDIEMPVMDGLTAIPKILTLNPEVQIIIASTLSKRNAEVTIRSLALGAKDYIPKPESLKTFSESQFHREFVNKVRALGNAKKKHVSISEKKPELDTNLSEKIIFPLRKDPVVIPSIIAIGSSTGGPKALSSILKELPNDIHIPILVTQHMPPTFTAILADHLARDSGRICREAKDGDLIERNKIYVAPGGFHMIVEAQGLSRIIRITDSPPENFCKPSVDPMLRSISEIYGPGALTIILTGMGNDGLKGSQSIVKNGGTVIAQNEETSVVWGMPGAVATAGLCSAILPLTKITSYIQQYLKRGVI